MSRIDRVLAQVEWFVAFPDIQLTANTWSLSDHRFMKLTFQRIDWGPKPFRALNGWLSHKDFRIFFKEEWRKLGIRPITEKLKDIKQPLRRWNREIYGHLDARLEQALSPARKAICHQS